MNMNYEVLGMKFQAFKYDEIAVKGALNVR